MCSAVVLCLCAGEHYPSASMDAISDDALFRDKLKHMGKCMSSTFITSSAGKSTSANLINDLIFPAFSNEKEALWNCQNILRKD